MLKDKWIAIVLGCVATVGVVVYPFSANDGKMVRQEVTVEQGQTLYQVVAKTVNEKNNINEVVSRALRENGIRDAGDIQPNQKIVVEYKK